MWKENPRAPSFGTMKSCIICCILELLYEGSSNITWNVFSYAKEKLEQEQMATLNDTMMQYMPLEVVLLLM